MPGLPGLPVLSRGYFSSNVAINSPTQKNNSNNSGTRTCRKKNPNTGFYLKFFPHCTAPLPCRFFLKTGTLFFPIVPEFQESRDTRSKFFVNRVQTFNGSLLLYWCKGVPVLQETLSDLLNSGSQTSRFSVYLCNLRALSQAGMSFKRDLDAMSRGTGDLGGTGAFNGDFKWEEPAAFACGEWMVLLLRGSGLEASLVAGGSELDWFCGARLTGSRPLSSELATTLLHVGVVGSAGLGLLLSSLDR
ncbi:hypothetical protein OGAPHI_007440 [Ogataea philodendri]|uniref:Uncharacterized protein n=1 Tax=Ogataea philodendri TaxID=1378263 RepID=A0A9P8NVD9_9ASCO|nr:uncharacterized protein OGAPHI_007440 [Ogataea philodendri]KAH3660235.1 hypothetical protein OGAPHI_007440 [Ogataea philodendri]